MEGRGVAGTSGAIWEVLPTLNWLATTLDEMLFQYNNVDFTDVDAPEDHIQATCNMAYMKILEYMRKLKDTPAYYAACRLHPRTKSYMDKVWAVPLDYSEEAYAGPHTYKGWLDDCHVGFQRLWTEFKEAASPVSTPEPPAKKARTGPASSRSDFMRATLQGDDARPVYRRDEFERWIIESPVPEESLFARDPILYWLGKADEYPVLSRFALTILSIPAAATDCERTFSELGDLLETRRLRMKADLLSALQSLRSWKRLGLKPTTAAQSPRNEAISPEELETIYEIYGS